MNETLKSELKSPPSEDAQGNVHPIRRLYACSFASGALELGERTLDGALTGPQRKRKRLG